MNVADFAEPGAKDRASIKKVMFPALDGEYRNASTRLRTGLSHFLDVAMELTAEVGTRTMAVREVLGLGAGSIVRLDRAAGEPLGVLLNGRAFARGEVVVQQNDRLAIRITQVEKPVQLRKGEENGQ